jgi:hypothetical protein
VVADTWVLIARCEDLGRYPETIVKEAGSRLPEFTDAQWKLIKGSSDL